MVFKTETLPDAINFTQVHVNPWVGEGFRGIIGEGCDGDHVKPAVKVEIVKNNVPVVRWCEKTLITTYVSTGSVLLCAVGQHTILIHE